MNDGDGTMPYDESGAVDNRLSLTPDQFPFTANWEDGETYTITAQVRQISPGEYEVIKATAQGASPQTDEPGNEEQPSGEQQEAAGEDQEEPASYPNPAVAKMMRSKG